MSDTRRRELARIHCLAKELGLSDDDYRAVLWTCARVESAKDLDQHGRQTVIEHMQQRKQRPTQGGQPKYDRSSAEQRKPRPGAERAGQTIKIQKQMQQLGVGDAYVDGIAKRMFGIQQWRWCSPDQLTKITASLWYAQRRQNKNGASA